MASTRGAGHGRVEARTLATSTWLNEYRADWPGLSQVFRLTRERTARGVTTVEVAYGLTSLARSEATAEDLLDFTRAHWGIESGLHYVRDVTFGEDKCRVRRGQSARVLASLRNAAIHLLRRENDTSLAATTRRLAAFPHQAVAMITTPASISA